MKITNFIAIIREAEEIEQFLQKQRNQFYDGGYSFEGIHSEPIKRLSELEEEFKNFSLNPCTVKK